MKFWHILLCELFIVMLMGIGLIKEMREENVNNISSLEQWKSEEIVYDTKQYSWYATQNDNQVTEFTIQSPEIKVAKGSYTLTLGYSCSENQNCAIEASGKNFTYNYLEAADNIVLNKNQNELIYHFKVKEDVSNLKILIHYNGQGNFAVYQADLSGNSFAWKENFVYTIFAFLAINIGFICRKWLKKNRTVIFLLSVNVLLTSIPLFRDGIMMGHDIDFHLMRIEGIAEELSLKNFPVRMSSLWIDGAGYPVSVYYGDILLYFPAFLRLLGFSVEMAYKYYLFAVNIGTAVIAYCCFENIFGRQKSALISTIVYCTTPYRIINLYVRAGVGEYSAMMFWPIVAMIIYKIYTKKCEEMRTFDSWKYALFLAIGISGLIETHIISTAMTVFILLIISIVFYKQTFHTKILLIYFKAIVIALCINAWFLIPFIDYYFNIPVAINNSVNSNVGMLQAGASIYDFFSLWGMTPGIVLIFFIGVGIYVWINDIATKQIKWLLIFSCMTLYMSSDLFLWNHFAETTKIGVLFTTLQFPWRYLGISSVFLTILMGEIIQNFGQNTKMNKSIEMIFLCTIVLTCYCINCCCSNSYFMRYYDRAEVYSYAYGSGEYLLTEVDKTMDIKIKYRDMETVCEQDRKGPYMELYCKGMKETEGNVTVPVFNYKGYHVIDKYGIEHEIIDDDSKYITFNLPAGYEGNVIIDFIEPWYWQASELVSVLSIIGLAFGSYIILYKKKII